MYFLCLFFCFFSFFFNKITFSLFLYSRQLLFSLVYFCDTHQFPCCPLLAVFLWGTPHLYRLLGFFWFWSWLLLINCNSMLLGWPYGHTPPARRWNQEFTDDISIPVLEYSSTGMAIHVMCIAIKLTTIPTEYTVYLLEYSVQ